jgi:hypothetical protein
MLLTSNLPQDALSSRPLDNPDGQLLMVSDYLMAVAFTLMRDAGLPVLGSFSRACAALVAEAHDRPSPSDPRGHLAAFLTEVVGRARGTPPAGRRHLCARNRGIAHQLHRRDHQNALLRRLDAHLFG